MVCRVCINKGLSSERPYLNGGIIDIERIRNEGLKDKFEYIACAKELEFPILARGGKWVKECVENYRWFEDRKEEIAKEIVSNYEKRFSGLGYLINYLSSAENARYHAVVEVLKDQEAMKSIRVIDIESLYNDR